MTKLTFAYSGSQMSMTGNCGIMGISNVRLGVVGTEKRSGYGTATVRGTAAPPRDLTMEMVEEWVESEDFDEAVHKVLGNSTILVMSFRIASLPREDLAWLRLPGDAARILGHTPEYTFGLHTGYLS